MPLPSAKFITIDNIRIAYYEQNPQLQHTVLFIHGNSGSARSWEKQFSSPAFTQYRLLAIDLPAHGQSSASPDPAGDYNVKGLGRIMAKAAQALLPAANYVLTGVSLGTNVIAEMLAYKAQPKGIALLGSCVTGEKYTLDKVFIPGADTGFLFRDEPPANVIETGFRSLVPTLAEQDLRQCIHDHGLVQACFRSTLLQSVMDNTFSDEPALIKQWGLPALVIFGKDEKAVNPDYLDDAPFTLWKNRVIKLPGGHFIQLDAADALNGYLSDYARDAFSDFPIPQP